MDIQTVIVAALVLGSAVFLIRKYSRSAKGAGGCGCGCDASCPSRKNSCGDQTKR